MPNSTQPGSRKPVLRHKQFSVIYQSPQVVCYGRKMFLLLAAMNMLENKEQRTARSWLYIAKPPCEHHLRPHIILLPGVTRIIVCSRSRNVGGKATRPTSPDGSDATCFPLVRAGSHIDASCIAPNKVHPVFASTLPAGHSRLASRARFRRDSGAMIHPIRNRMWWFVWLF